MTWWTSASGLTPLAVFDAAHNDGASMFDLAGASRTMSVGVSQKIQVQPAPHYNAVAGIGNPLAYSSSLSMPTNGVVIAFVRPDGDVIINARVGEGATYLLAMEGDAKWFLEGPSGHVTIPVSPGRDWQVVAIAFDATDYRIFVETAWADVSHPFTYRPTALDGLAYSYGHGLNGLLAAHGTFSGTVTESELATMAAAIKAEVTVDYSTLKTLDHSPYTYVDAPVPPGIPTGDRSLINVRDFEFGGRGRVAGTVKIKGSSSNTPVHRRVRLIRDRDGLVVREQWSNPTTGAYSFDWIDETKTYTVLAYDHTYSYRAVVADHVAPELLT